LTSLIVTDVSSVWSFVNQKVAIPFPELRFTSDAKSNWFKQPKEITRRDR